MFLHLSVISRGEWQTPSWEQTPPRAVHAGRYGQQTGGTHPTGMHTRCCCLLADFCILTLVPKTK